MQDNKSKWIADTLREHEAALLRYIWRLLGNIENAKEIVQETFLKLWSEEYPAIKSKIPQWLFFVSRNHAIDCMRKVGRARMSSHEEGQHSGEESHVNYAEQSIMSEHIMEKLQQLKIKQRDVILLKFQQDLSYKEIAEITGLTASNVGFLLSTGIKEIRNAFMNEEIA